MKITMHGFIILAAALPINLQAVPNFDLINADPTIPIHVQANGGPWQTLNQQHYRFPLEVPENNLLVMSLSANNDKSASTSLIFAPERALDVAKQVGSKISKAPTFYVEATVITEQVQGTDKTIKRIKLTPQKSHGTSNKTKSGLSLENNVTQEMIDVIVESASSDNPEPAEQAEPESVVMTEQIIETTEIPAAKTVQEPNVEAKPSEPQKVELPATQQAIGPTIQTTPLQHTDTPQMILARLKKITKQQTHTNKQAKWLEVRNYLTGQQAQDIFKDRDDRDIYNQLKEHYRTLADKTKSNLKKTYTRISEIITKAYTCANL